MKKIPKIRLDQMLVVRGLAKNRTQAKAMIMSGLIYSNTRCLDKAGLPVDETISLQVKGKIHPWVSRGGVKLAYAISHFKIDIIEKSCMDIGASSGGFTDVLLYSGAKLVYAVDVGYGQFSWKLRLDSRVIVLEKTNVRKLSGSQIPNQVDMVVADVSFISLKKALPAAFKLTKAKAELVALIKPQFEVGKNLVGKGGVVRDKLLHQKVCDEICNWVDMFPYWKVAGLVKSPILGSAGNSEFLIYAKKSLK